MDLLKALEFLGIWWCRKFAQACAHQICRRCPQPADKWHLDEGVIKIKGKKYYLWRAVDKQGQAIDILMQSRRYEAAADKFFREGSFSDR
mgnify:CR=1 FL=1